jgi:transketolase
MTVIAPCDAEEARAAIRAATLWDGPVYVRLTRDPIATITQPADTFEIGKARLLRAGSDIGIISTGTQTVRAMEAIKLLANDGIDAALLHVPTIKPLDESAIVDLARRVDCVLTCEEHSVLGGLGGATAEVLAAAYPTRVERLGIADVDGESGPNDALLHKYGLTAQHVVARARRMLARV